MKYLFKNKVDLVAAREAVNEAQKNLEAAETALAKAEVWLVHLEASQAKPVLEELDVKSITINEAIEMAKSLELNPNELVSFTVTANAPGATVSVVKVAGK